MASLENLVDIADLREMVRNGMTHLEIANHYRNLYQDRRGLSERSFRRYCKKHNITKITDEELDNIVGDFVDRYGHGYGRALMQGSIRASFGATIGVVSQKRVSKSLRRIAPVEFSQRSRDVLERTNPNPYFAPYFGYKVHMDQNEKIGQSFGCTHVALIDGCSRMIVGYASMPIKNPIFIYEFVFRPALLEFGVWNQLRVDHGKEFVLCLFVQELLQSHRYNKDKAPWRQTTSTDNNVIERFWPELNSRVNYPIKRAFISIRETFDYDLSDPVMKFSISWVTRYVAADAADHLIKSWNFHRVPGPSGCIPIENMHSTKRNVHIIEPLIPTVCEAVKMYEEGGGNLTRDAEFGHDPLILIEHAYESRKHLFVANQPSSGELFSDIVHGDYQKTKGAIDHFYNLTMTLKEQFVE